MKNLVKKSLLLGLGAASLTRKKIQRLVGPLIRENLISKKDAAKIVKKVVAEGEREKRRIKKLIAVEIKKAKPLVKKAGSKAKKSAKGIAKRALRKIR